VTEAFQRVLRGQREWAKVGKTIADREGKLADAEWVNTQIFLRCVQRGIGGRGCLVPKTYC